jgi:hypothetical protein
LASTDKEAAIQRVPLALIGTVYRKVDASYQAIEIGDLLTTFPTIGHAMKAMIRYAAFGAVIGKTCYRKGMAVA